MPKVAKDQEVIEKDYAKSSHSIHELHIIHVKKSNQIIESAQHSSLKNCIVHIYWIDLTFTTLIVNEISRVIR